MITFRNVSERDSEFIEKVYRSTREDELKLTNWSEDQKQRFIMMQSMAQLADYKQKFKGATYQVILFKNKPAGRLFQWESDEAIHVIDISLLPEFRGKGIGKKILTDILQSAKTKNKKVTLNVLKNSDAKRLYSRLGFKKTKDSNQHYEYMEWRFTVR